LTGSFGDGDVVGVAFFQSAAGDADEGGALAQFFEVFRSDITHAAAKTAEKLEDGIGERTAIGHPCLDALGDELAGRILAVTIARAFAHRLERAHPAVFFPGASLIVDGLAGAFAATGEERSQHDDVSPRRHRFDDVTRVTDAAVGDERDALFAADHGDILNRGELRQPDPGDHARRADRSGTDPDLHGRCARRDKIGGPLGGDDVPGNDGSGKFAA